AFARRLASPAERTPVHGFGYYTFVGTDGRMGNARRCRADGGPALLHRARGLDHQAAERHHGDVARADTLLRAVADRAHALPHRDILVGDTRNAGEVAVLHRGAVLLVIVLAGADAVEVRIHVDAPFQHVELAPWIRTDAGLVGAAPGNEIEDRGVVVLGGEQRRDVVHVVRRDQRGEWGDVDRGADVV